ncbi:MAG: hypothetical protein MJZ90_02635 [Bacteroidales bacterium]|nr:hypothetical protein [Bacteroidales bacterium]
MMSGFFNAQKIQAVAFASKFALRGNPLVDSANGSRLFATYNKNVNQWKNVTKLRYFRHKILAKYAPTKMSMAKFTSALTMFAGLWN